ncbi:hypothetical protein DFH07DRAFT_972972 [Mycena maculata]|uniref:Uncharacterized protein n=1 Tax=Mycena maculata TaxID=230809 RepID=A0AAD7MIQ5_9AGAR|nr:hypothetical protein DFH07DRAFT_972972 [Mycena maculata]
MQGKTEIAVPEMVKTWQALGDLEVSLEDGVVEEWTKMAVAWEADMKMPNPYETQHKDQHVAKVRAELAMEVAEREAEKKEDVGAVRGERHITEVIGMGLQLEDQQRVLAFDVVGTGLHPTDGQQRTMTERQSKLRWKVFAWIELQTSFFPVKRWLWAH